MRKDGPIDHNGFTTFFMALHLIRKLGSNHPIRDQFSRETKVSDDEIKKQAILHMKHDA